MHHRIRAIVCTAIAAALGFLLSLGAGPEVAFTRVARADPTATHARRDPVDLVVCTLPLGPHDEELLALAEAGIHHVYGFSTRRLPAHKLPRKAYYKPRKRYRADKLLDYIDDHVTADGCLAVIGFTRRDISTTKGKYRDWGILGLGEIGGSSAVVSTFRLTRRVGRRQGIMRTVKVVNHELGHVLGLDHYDGERGCMMNDAGGTVKTVDEERGLLCVPSREYVEKTHDIRLPERDAVDWDAIIPAP